MNIFHLGMDMPQVQIADQVKFVEFTNVLNLHLEEETWQEHPYQLKNGKTKDITQDTQ